MARPTRRFGASLVTRESAIGDSHHGDTLISEHVGALVGTTTRARVAPVVSEADAAGHWTNEVGNRPGGEATGRSAPLGCLSDLAGPFGRLPGTYFGGVLGFGLLIERLGGNRVYGEN